MVLSGVIPQVYNTSRMMAQCNPGRDVLPCDVHEKGGALQTPCSSLFLHPLLHYRTLYACSISIPVSGLASSQR